MRWLSNNFDTQDVLNNEKEDFAFDFSNIVKCVDATPMLTVCKSKTPMFTDDYNKALTFAEYDIKSNWKIYKKAFVGGTEYEEDNG